MRIVAAPRLLDIGVAALLAGLAVAELWVPFDSVQGDGSRPVATVSSVVVCLALAARRQHPLATALVVLGGWPVFFVMAPIPVLFWGQFVPMVVAVFSVARYCRGRRLAVGGAVAAGALLFVDVAEPEMRAPSELAFHWGVFLVAFVTGRGLGLWETRAAESTSRAVRAEVEAADLAWRAVVEERTRIARELHDIVAHAVSSIVVQAGAAEQVVDSDPAAARRSLGAIRRTGADALADMRRVVTVLREDEGDQPFGPQPGLDAVPALVRETGDATLAVRLLVEGTPRQLPAGLDLAAYRVVQEALTNVRRHAAATSAEVEVRYDEDALWLTVRDDGRGHPVPVGGADASGGHGLVGMRERVGLYGGTVEAANREAGGYEVRVRLPWESR